ncbi:hypothetical protein D3C73_1452410 [compost metagenome]
MHKRGILLRNLTRDQLFGNMLMDISVLGDRDNPARFLIQAMYRTKADGLPFFPPVMHHTVSKRARVMSVRRVHDDPGSLVYDQQGFILVNNIKRNRFR